MTACKYWLNSQIEEVKPKYIGLLGNVALEQVLGVKGIRKLRGRPIEKDGVTPSDVSPVYDSLRRWR